MNYMAEYIYKLKMIYTWIGKWQTVRPAHRERLESVLDMRILVEVELLISGQREKNPYKAHVFII